MSTPQTLALDLSKLNLSLHLQLLQLAQQNASQWLALGQSLLDSNAAGESKAASALAGISDWSQMAQLPGDTYWAQWQQFFNNLQKAIQESISAQTRTAAEAQKMLREWQQQVLQSIGCLTAPLEQAQQSQQPAWQAAMAPMQGLFEAIQGSMQGLADTSWVGQWQQAMASAMQGLPDFTGTKK